MSDFLLTLQWLSSEKEKKNNKNEKNNGKVVFRAFGSIKMSKSWLDCHELCRPDLDWTGLLTPLVLYWTCGTWSSSRTWTGEQDTPGQMRTERKLWRSGRKEGCRLIPAYCNHDHFLKSILIVVATTTSPPLPPPLWTSVWNYANAGSISHLSVTSCWIYASLFLDTAAFCPPHDFLL